MSIFSSSSALSLSANANPGWVASAWTSMQQEMAMTGGMLGALQNSKHLNGSTSSFLSVTSGLANSMALIAQGGFSGSIGLTTQIASTRIQKEQQDAVQKSLESLSAPTAKAGPELDPMIFFGNGSTLDTRNNILTLADGTQLDSITGVKIKKATDIMELSNGSWIDLANHIMNLTDGTQIDTVTGQTIAVSA